jgi:hypothetical protein
MVRRKFQKKSFVLVRVSVEIIYGIAKTLNDELVKRDLVVRSQHLQLRYKFLRQTKSTGHGIIALLNFPHGVTPLVKYERWRELKTHSFCKILLLQKSMYFVILFLNSQADAVTEFTESTEKIP